MKTATVIGLGMMGTTLARLFLRAGYRVTVWNRSPQRAEDLITEGAVLAATPEEAVAASEFVVICVLDYPAADAILKRPAVEAVLKGRTLIQLTTGAAQEARESAAWAQAHDARYLDGAIQAAPEQMGNAATMIMIAGEEATFQDSESFLRALGGDLVYLGADASAANAMDLATLSLLYGSTLGFLHGVLLAESAGIPLDRYGAMVEKIAPAIGEIFRHEANVIQSGDFTISQSPLRISTEATARLLAVTEAEGLNPRFPNFVVPFFREATAAGLGDEELAALIKVFRTSPQGQGA